MRRYGLCLILYLLLVLHSFSQSGNLLGLSPVPQNKISYYTDILTLINPASAFLKERFTLNSKIASYSGIRKDISEYYIDGWFKFKEREKLALGAQFYSDNEGSSIRFQTGKFYPRYSIHLSEKWRINASIGVGFMSYTFEGNNVTAGGSDMIADFDLGVCLQSEKWTFGVSRMHIINNRLQPILASFEKNRLINICIGKRLVVNEEIGLNILGVVSDNLTLHKLVYDATIETIYKERLKLITLLYHTNLLGLGGGLQKVRTAIGDFSMNFIYTIGLMENKPLNSNRYEIGLSYYIGKSN